MEPQEIEDEEHEQILERAAAVDVAKASGMVCTRVPHQARGASAAPGCGKWTRPRTRSWNLLSTWPAEGIEKVTLESTS